MFETVHRAPQWSSPRSLTASVVVHGAMVAVILSLRFAPVAAHDAFRRVQTITLIAPSRQTSVRPAPEPQTVLRPLPRAPRPFRISPARPHRALALALDLPAAPVLETPNVSLPALELPRVVNLARTTPEPSVMIKPAGFSGIETYVRRSPRSALSATGSFDTAATQKPAAPRPTLSPASGFGDTSVATPAPTASRPATAPLMVPVEIFFKPRPAYTSEALRLRIEGEVLLEVLFRATGEMDIIGVLRGLGHGLDESAMAAARQIRFGPAHSEGGPVDSPAIIHIVFQLAY